MGAALSLTSDKQGFATVSSSLPSMDGKTCCITGCTSGIGFVLACELARKGAVVLMLNRPSERAKAALAKVRQLTPKAAAAHETVVHIDCDLSNFSGVRAAAKAVLEETCRLGGLDVLVNNAGIVGAEDKATADGCDMMMQANFLSHFLLTKEVFPALEQAAQSRGEARIINHTSIERNRVDLDAAFLQKNGGNLGGDSLYARVQRYAQSKNAAFTFTYALHERLAASGSKVKALVSHPGVVATPGMPSAGKHDASLGCFWQVVTGVVHSVAQTEEDGTVPMLLSCCEPDAQSGDFYGPTGNIGGHVQKLNPEPRHTSQRCRQLLWEESCRTLGIEFEV